MVASVAQTNGGCHTVSPAELFGGVCPEYSESCRFNQFSRQCHNIHQRIRPPTECQGAPNTALTMSRPLMSKELPRPFLQPSLSNCTQEREKLSRRSSTRDRQGPPPWFPQPLPWPPDLEKQNCPPPDKRRAVPYVLGQALLRLDFDHSWLSCLGLGDAQIKQAVLHDGLSLHAVQFHREIQGA